MRWSMYVGPNRVTLWLGGGFISLVLFEKEVAGKIKRKIGGKGHALD